MFLKYAFLASRTFEAMRLFAFHLIFSSSTRCQIHLGFPASLHSFLEFSFNLSGFSYFICLCYMTQLAAKLIVYSMYYNDADVDCLRLALLLIHQACFRSICA